MTSVQTPNAQDLAGTPGFPGAPTAADVAAQVRENSERALKWLRGELTTTPGRWRLWSIAAIALSILTALVSFLTIDGQVRRVSELRDRRGVAIISAHRLHVALLKADAAATRGFLFGADEPAVLRKSYSDGLAEAANRLAEVARNTDTADGRKSIATLGALIPDYAGRVEAARTNNRLGNATGAAYLRSASELLRTTMTTEIEKLETGNITRFQDRHRGVAAGKVWTFPVLLLLLLGLLLYIQRGLRNTTKRTINPPLLAASVLVVFSLLFGVTSLGRERSRTKEAVQEDLRKAVGSAKARVAMFGARTDESLALIVRSQSLENLQRAYAGSALARELATVSNGDGSIASVNTKIESSTKLYQDGIEEVYIETSFGSLKKARDLATSGKTTEAFNGFDDVVRQAEANSVQRFAQEMTNGRSAVRRMRTWVPILTLLAGLLAMFGLQLRMNEYR